jgi:spermidine synthase
MRFTGCSSYGDFRCDRGGLPDPTNFAIGKLFTNSFYSLLDKRLAASGYAVIQTTSPLIAYVELLDRGADRGVRGSDGQALSRMCPVLANGALCYQPPSWREPWALPAGMRFLTLPTLRLMFDFPLDMARVPTEVNRPSNQVLVNTYEREWGKVEH